VQYGNPTTIRNVATDSSTLIPIGGIKTPLTFAAKRRQAGAVIVTGKPIYLSQANAQQGVCYAAL